MRYAEFEEELKKLSKEEIIEFIDNFDSYLAQHYIDNNIRPLPMNAPNYFEAQQNGYYYDED